MVVEKLVEYYLVFLAYYCDGTFHYPMGQHLNERDISRLVDLRTVESTYHLNVKTLTKNFLLFVAQLHHINSRLLKG